MKWSAVASVVFGVLLVGCKEEAPDKKSLIVLTAADYQPYTFMKNGKLTGFDIELMQDIAKRLNKTVEFRDVAFDDLFKILEKNEADAAVAAITPTAQRQKTLDFSSDYFVDTHVLLFHDIDPVRTIADLAQEKVGIQRGSFYEDYAKKDLVSSVSGVRLQSESNMRDLITHLMNRQVKGVIMGYAEGLAVTHSLPSLKMTKILTDTAGLAIAFPKNSPIKAKVNAVLKDMEKDGTLSTLQLKWLKKPPVSGH